MTGSAIRRRWLEAASSVAPTAGAHASNDMLASDVDAASLAQIAQSATSSPTELTAPGRRRQQCGWAEGYGWH
jgi:hypothetical protein